MLSERLIRCGYKRDCSKVFPFPSFRCFLAYTPPPPPPASAYIGKKTSNIQFEFQKSHSANLKRGFLNISLFYILLSIGTEVILPLQKQMQDHQETNCILQAEDACPFWFPIWKDWNGEKQKSPPNGLGKPWKLLLFWLILEKELFQS